MAKTKRRSKTARVKARIVSFDVRIPISHTARLGQLTTDAGRWQDWWKHH